MRTVEEYRNYGQDLYHKLHLSTFPISIKYIKTEDEIPKAAIRPSIMGDKMSICQAFTHARNNGVTVALMSDDNFCLPSTVQHRWVDISFKDLIESQNLQGRTYMLAPACDNTHSGFYSDILQWRSDDAYNTIVKL